MDVTSNSGAAASLEFPATARLELDTVLEELRDRAEAVLSTQGRLRGLLRANAAVAADLSLPVVLQRVADAARELLAARYAAIGVHGRDGQLEQFVHSGLPADAAERLGHAPTGEGWLSRPIRVGDTVFGTLYVTERTDGAGFSEEDEQLAAALAVAAGGAIANARLFTESEQRRRWLTASGELTTHVLSPDTHEPLTALAEFARLAALADFATVTVAHGADGVLVAAASGARAAQLVGVVAPMSESLAGLAMRTGKALLVLDHKQLPACLAPDAKVGPVLVVPLTAGERTSGALLLGRDRDRPAFTDADLGMAVVFAGQAAVALELVDARADELRTELLNDHDRIAGDLHDHVVQELFAVGMGLQGLATVTAQPAQVQRILGYVDILDAAISALRTAVFGLQPTRQDPMGLQARILTVTAEHTAQLGYSPYVRFAGPLDLRVTGALAADVLAVIREAVSNCARHAHATRLDVVVVLTAASLSVEVTDNGVGVGTPSRASGTANLRRRAERHRGSLAFTTPDGGGTRLTWTVGVPD